MSFAYHGNYCGPGWSAGQYKDAKDLTQQDFDRVPAIDTLDEICKAHDYDIWQAYQLFPLVNGRRSPMHYELLTQADAKLITAIHGSNVPLIKGRVASFMVWILGPTGRVTRAMDYVRRHYVDEPGMSLFNLPCEVHVLDMNENEQDVVFLKH